MENLWPEDLINDFTGADRLVAETILESQARGLSARTGGLVTGNLCDRSLRPSRMWSLMIQPLNQPAKVYELLIVRSPNGKFPLVIEAVHLEQRFTRIESQSAMISALTTILAAPNTRNIVKILADEAKAAGFQPVHDVENTQFRETARPIAIGHLFRSGGEEMAQVSFLGISGFIEAETVRKIAQLPINRNDLIESMNNHFIVSLSFKGAVKATLSTDELSVLQAQARLAHG